MCPVMRQRREELGHLIERAQAQRGAGRQQHPFTAVIGARMRRGEHDPAGERGDEAGIGVREVVVLQQVGAQSPSTGRSGKGRTP